MTVEVAIPVGYVGLRQPNKRHGGDYAGGITINFEVGGHDAMLLGLTLTYQDAQRLENALKCFLDGNEPRRNPTIHRDSVHDTFRKGQNHARTNRRC